MPTRPHIWLVDDEPDVRFIFERTLSTAGFRVSLFEDGESALDQLKSSSPSLIVLDVTMPGYDGWKTLKEFRKRGYSQSILMLTSTNDPDSRVRGLESGADDYLGKPCTHAEFIARIKALLRRAPHRRLPSSQALSFGGIIVDLEAKTASRGSAPVRLTRTDYALLTVLWEQIGKTVSRDSILGRVWEGQGGGSHALDTHLWRLRKKLGDDTVPPAWIQSQSGVGYRLSPTVLLSSKQL